MSPWSRDRLGIALYPDRLVAARIGGRLKRRVKETSAVALSAPRAGERAWRPAVDALAQHVAAGGCRHAELTLVLSSLWVRYVLVPASPALRTEEEQLAYARERCRTIHGPAADGWTLHADAPVRGKPRVACAAETGLLDAIAEAMAPVARRYRSLQPHFMTSFNRWRRRLSGDAQWVVVQEPGVLTVGLLHEGAWRSLHSLPAGPDWPERLAGVLTRAQCMAELPRPVMRVALIAEAADAAPTAPPWELECLAEAAPGRGVDPAAACAAWAVA